MFNKYKNPSSTYSKYQIIIKYICNLYEIWFLDHSACLF